MNNEDMSRFIDTYGKYYYKVSKDIQEKGKKNLGLSIIHPTDKDDEEIIEKYLIKGEQNVSTIAWKLGANSTSDGIRTQYYEYPISAIEAFCKSTNELNLSFDDAGLLDSYNAILEKVTECDLVGYGSVYIISSMFFLSKGQVPIYDYYANVAVKALLYDICPQDVYVAQAPGKEEHSRNDKSKKSAVNMLLEYKHMLEELAKDTDHFGKDGMFISRELDRALWVYGHANKKWNNEMMDQN